MIVLLLIVVACVPLQALAATTAAFTAAAVPKVIITEVQTTGGSASQEFVELYNTTDADIDLADTANAGKEVWKLQFFSAASTASGTPDWTKPSATVSLNGVIAAHDYFLLTSTGYAPGGIDGDEAYSSRLSDTGGGLQLITSAATVTTTYDRVMWKQPVSGQALPAGVIASPPANGSLQRLPNDNSEYVQADGTLTDFAPEDTISPKDMWQSPTPIEEPAPDPASADPTGTTTDPTTDPTDNSAEQPVVTDPVIDDTGLVAPYITELLPNPAEPQTDANDEFIEVYNPNQTSFELKGYTFEVGTTTLHDFTFASSVVLEPLSYRAFYSMDTGLSLTNSGGHARLLDTTGTAVSQTDSYGAADDGAAWALADGVWQWTTTPTPNAGNIITAPAAHTTTTGASKTTTAKSAKKTTTAKTTSAKIKGTSSTKAKKAATTKTTKAKKTKKPKAQITTVSDTTAEPVRAPIHPQVLVVVAVLAVLYAAYEYRSDISNRFYKLRHHRAVRKFLRLST